MTILNPQADLLEIVHALRAPRRFARRHPWLPGRSAPSRELTCSKCPPSHRPPPPAGVPPDGPVGSSTRRPFSRYDRATAALPRPRHLHYGFVAHFAV